VVKSHLDPIQVLGGVLNNLLGIARGNDFDVCVFAHKNKLAQGSDIYFGRSYTAIVTKIDPAAERLRRACRPSGYHFLVEPIDLASLVSRVRRRDSSSVMSQSNTSSAYLSSDSNSVSISARVEPVPMYGLKTSDLNISYPFFLKLI